MRVVHILLLLLCRDLEKSCTAKYSTTHKEAGVDRQPLEDTFCLEEEKEGKT